MKEGRLGKVTAAIIDYRGKTPKKSTHGIKLLTAKVIKGGSIDESRLEYISKETYKLWMSRGFPKQWDILLTTEAPLGETALLRSHEPIALAQRVILLRGNPEIIDQLYLFAALRSPLMQARLRQRATGTTVLGIKQSELRMVEIPLPPPLVQHRVAYIVSAYDDLIENNKRRIKLLEEMVQRIYREWFIHFRYPGHENAPLIDSALAHAPGGWASHSLANPGPLHLTKARVQPYLGERRYIATADCDGFHDLGDGVKLDFASLPSRAQHVPVSESIWFGRMAGYQKVMAFPSGSPDIDAIVLSSGFLGVQCEVGWFAYTLATILADGFEAKKASFATGTTQVSLTDQGAKAIGWLLPDFSTVASFERLVRPIFEQVLILRRACQALREARDLLLPRLISGEIDVTNLNIATPEVVA